MNDVTPVTVDATPSAAQDWRTVVVNRWSRLGCEVLGASNERQHRLTEISHECDFLAVIVAWFMYDGNITYTAQALRSSRRAIRARVVRWREQYPHLLPPALQDGSTEFAIDDEYDQDGLEEEGDDDDGHGQCSGRSRLDVRESGAEGTR